jgi:O-antigen/teichoic acid export membrane protein
MDETTPVPAAGAQQTRLRTDVFVTFGGKLSTLLFAFALSVLIARELGPSGNGLFAVAYTLTLVLVQVGALGFTTANPYFVARDASLLPRIVANSLWLSALLGFALAVVGVLLKAVAPGIVEGLGWVPLVVTLAGLPGALSQLFLQSVLLGEGRVVAYNAIEVLQAALALVALAIGFYAFDIGLTGVLVVVGASRYAATAIYLALLVRHAPPLRRLDRELVNRMLRYGFRVYAGIVLSFLLVRFDLLLVNGFLGHREAGVYSVAATMADGMFVLPMVIGLNLFTRVARGDPTEATAQIFRSVAVLYGLVCLVTIPLAEPAIRLFFGERFSEAAGLYYWLLAGIYSLGMLTLLSSHFAGRGYPIRAMLTWVFGLALNIGLNLVFLPGRGAWVAALTSSICYSALLLLHMWLFAKEAGGFGAMRPRLREVVSFVRFALAR